MFKIAMGAKVKDRISGFEGTVTGRAEYLTGCRQYLITPKSEKSKIADAAWLDEDRLHDGPAENAGGPQNYAPARATVRRK